MGCFSYPRMVLRSVTATSRSWHNVTVSRPRVEILGFFESYQATSDTPFVKVDVFPCYGSVDRTFHGFTTDVLVVILSLHGPNLQSGCICNLCRMALVDSMLARTPPMIQIQSYQAMNLFKLM